MRRRNYGRGRSRGRKRGRTKRKSTYNVSRGGIRL